MKRKKGKKKKKSYKLSIVDVFDSASTASDDLTASAVGIGWPNMAIVVRSSGSSARNHVSPQSLVANVPLLHCQNSSVDLRVHFKSAIETLLDIPRRRTQPLTAQFQRVQLQN